MVRLPERPGDDGFAAALLVPGGALDDPPGLEGLTTLAAHAALLGTGGDPDRLTPPARRALRLGGRLVPVADGAVIGWFVEGPARAAPRLLALLADLAHRPRLPATRLRALAEMAREARAATRGLVREDARDWAVGLALKAPRPLPISPHDGTLSAVHREDVARHHVRLWQGREVALAVEGAGLDTIEGAFARWRRGPPPIHPRLPCRGAVPYQGWMAAPARDAAVVVALPVPGRGAPQRAALEATLAALDRGTPSITLEDRGRRAALVLTAEGEVRPALARIDRWLIRAAEAQTEGSYDQAMNEARRRVAHERAEPRLLAAAGALALAPHPGAPRAGQVATPLAQLLADPDRRARVAIGPETARRTLATWGPVAPLTRRTTLCAPGAQ